MTAFIERRKQLLERMGASSVAIVAAAPTFIRNNDVEHPYRQDSDLYYLTGFEEPSSVLVLTTQHAEHKAVLFLQPRDPDRETWDGPRLGVEDAVSKLGIDAAFPIAELAAKLPDYLKGPKTLHYQFGKDAKIDETLLDLLKRLRARARTGDTPPSQILDIGLTLHEMRLRKSALEIETMKKAVEITQRAHLKAMEIAKPGRYEYEIEAAMAHVYRSHGSDRPAYESIVGSGPNATVLHYRSNHRRMEDGDLLLIDAGCEFGLYASDVTRTFPINGKFMPEQKAIYQVVLDAQEAAINEVHPGSTIDEVHRVTVRVLVEGMIRIGLLSGEVDKVIEENTYKKFYMHRTSHWLGMDVHDVGAYFVDGAARKFEPGFVLTVEPGIYVATHAEVDARWRGIGVRIEDDVLVTASGNEVLTAGIPKKVEELERVLGSR